MSSIDSTSTRAESPSQPPSSQSQSFKPASVTSTYDDDEACERLLKAKIAWKGEWKQCKTVDGRKQLAYKWYRELLRKKEDDPLPSYISKDLWRHAKDAEVEGKEEDVWHELMVFLYWRKKCADEKRHL